MNAFKKDEILVLLGAGASVKAGIPHSSRMAATIEELISDEWSEFRDLYYYIKSSIHYSDGLRGRFGPQVNFNIERLVNTLDELMKKEEHLLFPFIGSWNPKLLEVAGANFFRLGEFRRKIVEILRNKWLALEYDDAAGYFKGLARFQSEYQHPLRVFSLNYDLCVELACGSDYVERGFEDKTWDWRRFELEDKPILLYKLHGSTDWVRQDGKLTFKSNPSIINHDQAEIIFGTSYKLQYVDPFLFFAYELRKWSLAPARLIIAIGYSYSDEHINGILAQALNGAEEKVLLSIAPIDITLEARCRELSLILGLRSTARSRIVCWNVTAEEFMQSQMNLTKLSSELFPIEETLFTEISADASGKSS